MNIIKQLTLTSSIHQHKSGKILKTALDRIKIHYEKSECKTHYKSVFDYIDFDNFAKIKELYTSKHYEFIPSWNEYFLFHDIKVKALKTNADPIRIYFVRIKAPSFRNPEIIRSPFFLNLDDIDYAGYYKLLKYLIMLSYTNDYYNASALSIQGKKAAIETDKAYIMNNKCAIFSLNKCIKYQNEEGIRYLIEELGILPNWHQLNEIEKKFSDYLYDLAAFYFE